MKSLPPKDFESLPPLDSPAGYICVIRDIDRDRYRIEATHWPWALVESVIAEDDRSFGIELVSVLQSADLSASEAELYQRYHARPSSEWLQLDSFQLDELRRSVLQIDAHASHYLTRDSLSRSAAATSGALEEPASRSASPANLQSYGPNPGRWERRRPRAPIPDVRYGFQALRRNRRAAEARQRDERRYRLSTEDQIKEYIGDFLLNHIIKITAIGFALFFLFLVYAISSYSH